MVMSIEEDLLFSEVQVYGYTDTIRGSRQALESLVAGEGRADEPCLHPRIRRNCAGARGEAQRNPPDFAGREFTLRATPVLRRHFVLSDGSRQIGSIAPNSVFARRAAVDLPQEWPLPVRVFIIWLKAIFWMRDVA
jgi:hypothetical protein